MTANERPYWQAYAECREHSPRMFFPEKGVNVAYAKGVCARCQVREQCLEYAMQSVEVHGVWGGLTHRERVALRREQRIEQGLPANGPMPSQRSVAKCGTVSGYNRHRREGEETCELCRAAHNLASSERVRRHREAKRQEAA